MMLNDDGDDDGVGIVGDGVGIVGDGVGIVGDGVGDDMID